jgi:ketosteroid isomerase-like protein
MSEKDEVRKVSERFYVALNSMLNGDAGPLAKIWSHANTVTTMHPIGGQETGWDGVRDSFDQVAGLASGGNVQLRDQTLRVIGDMAYEVGNEQGQVILAGEKAPIEHRVTNIYCREGGAWKLVHHHTDISPAMVEILDHVKAKA